MLKQWKLSRALLLFSLVLGANISVAAEDSFELNGFLTQGFVYTDGNSFYGDSQSGSFDFHELGVNASWRVHDDMLVTGQLVSRLTGEVDDGDPQVDYLLLDYRLFENYLTTLGVGVGRIKNPFGFYNKTRDVAFTRPSIVLPQSLYFDKARNLELSSDGGLLYGRHLFSKGIIESEIVVGAPRKDLNVEYAYLNRDWPGAFNNSEGFLWRTEYSSSDYSLVAAVSYGEFRLDFDGPEQPFPGAPGDGHVDIDISALSLQYNKQHWSLTSEYFLQGISWGSLGGAYAIQPESTSQSFYIQLEYRFSPQVSFFVRRDRLYLDRDDKTGEQVERLFGKPAHTQYAFDWTVGMGWRPDQNWLFRAEWHKVEGTGWLAVQDNPDDAEREEHWNMFLLQATYRF